MRRSRASQSVINTGKLTVNLDTKTVEVQGSPRPPDGQRIPDAGAALAPQGTTLTKEMFLNHLYGGMDEPELKIIDVFICKLRKKLAMATEATITSRRSGARLCNAATRRRRPKSA